MFEWHDPDRWVESDMQRDAWVRRSGALLLLVIIITLVVIFVGVWFS